MTQRVYTVDGKVLVEGQKEDLKKHEILIEKSEDSSYALFQLNDNGVVECVSGDTGGNTGGDTDFIQYIYTSLVSTEYAYLNTVLETQPVMYEFGKPYKDNYGVIIPNSDEAIYRMINGDSTLCFYGFGQHNYDKVYTLEDLKELCENAKLKMMNVGYSESLAQAWVDKCFIPLCPPDYNNLYTALFRYDGITENPAINFVSHLFMGDTSNAELSLIRKDYNLRNDGAVYIYSAKTNKIYSFLL